MTIDLLTSRVKSQLGQSVLQTFTYLDDNVPVGININKIRNSRGRLLLRKAGPAPLTMDVKIGQSRWG